MDPNAALEAILGAIEDVGYGDDRETLRRMVENFEALDEWLSKGGFLPERWKR